jgi:hypothetical protein
MYMSNRSTKFVGAIFASLLVGSSLPTISYSATNTADAADTCVSGPKGAPPQGGHWYYRIDRSTKRHCWYVGDEREKLARSAPRNSSPPAEPASSPNNAAAQRSVADAHAELPSPQTWIGQASMGQQVPAIAPNAMSTENQSANVQDPNAQRSVFASRWPESSGVNSPADPGPATDDSDATAQADSTAEPTPTLAAVTLAAADASPQSETGSIQMLLVVILGALALAGLMGSAIFRFGSSRRIIRLDRRTIWDSAGSNQQPPSIYPNPVVPKRRVEIPRELREADDPNGRIEAMLARLARSAAH